MNKAILHKKYLLWIAAAILITILLSAIFIVTLPGITKITLNDWLEDQGLSSQIDNIDINLFTGEVRLTSVILGISQKPKLNLGDLRAKILLRDLWQKRVTIENISLSDVSLDIKKHPSGLYSIGGIKVGDKEQESVNTPGNSAESAPWTFRIRNVSLKNIKSCYSETDKTEGNKYNVCLKIKESKLKEKSVNLTDKSKISENIISNASFNMKDAKLYDNKNNAEIVSVREIVADKLTIDKKSNINIPNINLFSVKLIKKDNAEKDTQEENYSTIFKKINLSSIKINNFDNYLIESIIFNDMQSNLVRDKNGHLESIKILRSSNTSSEKKDKSTSKNISKLPKVIINDVHIAGDSYISIVDYSVTPVFREKIDDFELKLSNINTGDTSKISPVITSFLIGKRAKTKINGNIAFFSERTTADLNGSIHRLNAANYTGYTFDFIKHHVKRGLVNADFNIKINKGIHDSVVKLDLKKFYIEEGSESANQYYIKEFGVPLPRALSMLREKDESIILSMLIKGDTKDPQFSWVYSVNNMIADAIKKSIVNYYTNVSFKITILKQIFKTVKSLSFESVTYQPLKTDLDNSKKELLNNLVKLLNDRPHIELAICGYATQEDRLKLYPDTTNQDISNISDDENGEEFKSLDIKKVKSKLLPQQMIKLNELALQRQTKLIAYLVKEKGIEAKRFIPCNPTYSDADAGLPRVEFSF